MRKFGQLSEEVIVRIQNRLWHVVYALLVLSLWRKVVLKWRSRGDELSMPRSVHPSKKLSFIKKSQ
jgi:hypothetical protein